MRPLRMACLCPTYGRPKALANSIALFMAQLYPVESKRLFILDDAGQYTPVFNYDLELHSLDGRFPSMPSKYQHLTAIAEHWQPDAVVLWDDDDLYLPNHLERIAAAMSHGALWCHPYLVLSNYTRKMEFEPTAGRFWAAAAMCWKSWVQMGGVPQTRAADFDQLFLRKAKELYGPAVSPVIVPRDTTFVFRWHGTGYAHAQSHITEENSAGGWYDRMHANHSFVGEIHPQFDDNFINDWASILQTGVCNNAAIVAVDRVASAQLSRKKGT